MTHNFNEISKTSMNLNLLDLKDLPKKLNITLNSDNKKIISKNVKNNNLSDEIKKSAYLKLNDFNIELYQYILKDLQYKDACKNYQNEIKKFLELELKKFLNIIFE